MSCPPDKAVIAGERAIVEEPEKGTYFWCACGRSQTQPYCDGSHAGTDFEPVRVEIEEKKRVAWCACKQSEKGAFCDGSHKRLREKEASV